jgi:hypothetical protein
MKKLIGVLAVAVLAACVLVSRSIAGSASWTEDFGIDKADLSSAGSNPYFILEPGYQLYFEGRSGALTITVLDVTKTIDGVETRVVEERETEGDKLKEISRNYFAISNKTNSVFYFGEDCDEYNTDGDVVGHEGSWQAGANGAKAGLMMPGLVLLGARHYQEIAPKVAMDRAEILSMNETVQVPAGKFENVLKVEETSPLEPRSKEPKFYAPGVGLLKDGGLELVKYAFGKK